MAMVNTSTKSWTWAPEVLEFARETGVVDYLDPMREAVYRLFPTANRIRVLLEHDPEIPNDTHINFEVETAIRDATEYRAFSRAWGDEVFRILPAPLVCVFRELLIPVK